MNKSIHTLFFIGLISFIFSTVVTANVNTNPFIKGETWNGWYDCGEGRTKLKLTITEAVNNNGSRQPVSAIYDFTTLKGVNGAFSTQGRYRSRSRDAAFRPVSWIKRAPGYASPSFKGSVSSNGKEYIGRINYRGCGVFKLYSPKSDYLGNPSKYEEGNHQASAKSVTTDKKSTTLSPQELSQQYRLGLNAVNNGELDKAKHIFNGILSQNPDRIFTNGVKKQLTYIEKKKSLTQKYLKPSLGNSGSTEENNKKSSYTFETNRPPSRGSHSVNMHFATQKDLALVAENLDDIVKANLVKRAQQGKRTSRLQGQYNFFTNGKEIEWRRYKLIVNKGWDPVIGISLKKAQKNLLPSKIQRPIERFKYSIIEQSSTLQNDPENLARLFNLGFIAEGKVPPNYQFNETRKRPTSSEKWYNKKRHMMKGVSYSIEVMVNGFNTLINDRNKLVDFAKADLQKRVGNTQYDQISADYWFKSDTTNKRYVTIHLSKQAGGGFTVHSPLSLLELLATGNEKDISKRFRMSKAMFIAEQNGDKDQLNNLKKERIAQVESSEPKDNTEREIAANLNDIQKLPVLYISESVKWNKVGGLSSQEIARKALDKYGFPIKPPLSPEQINVKKQELIALIDTLGKKGAHYEKSAPRENRGNYTLVKLPAQQQKTLSEKVLYPSIMQIQSKTIDLLSRIPRTVQGLDEAYKMNGWLFNLESGYTRDWNELIKANKRLQGGVKQPVALCRKLSTKQQVGLGPKTGRCLFEITHSSRLLRDIWRIQYMRHLDSLISKKIKENGADLYRKAFLLAYNLGSENFDYHAQSNFTKWNSSPNKSSKNCLFDNCSSKLSKIFASEYSGKALTNARKKHYLAILEKKSNELTNRWNSSRGQSKQNRYSIQSDIINYSRDVTKSILLKLSNSAAKELEGITLKDQKNYRNWNKKTAKPIRLQAVAWRKLWDIGFGITREDNAVTALGLSSFKSGYVNARHSGGSPFNGIAEVLYDAQYKWVTKSEKGTTADATVDFPIDWSAPGSYQKPKRPTRHYGMLLTPSELFFESIGNQIGQASSALASHASMIAQLEHKIIKSRKQFFNCLPKCNNLKIKEATYSKALIEKDIYFLQLSGRSGSLADQGTRNITTVIEAASSSSGFTLVDGGIPKVCTGYFDRWMTKFGASHGQDSRAEIDAIFGAVQKLTRGELSSMKEAGVKMMQKQQKAFAKSATEYRKYQVCRDQYEFDQYEH